MANFQTALDVMQKGGSVRLPRWDRGSVMRIQDGRFVRTLKDGGVFEFDLDSARILSNEWRIMNVGRATHKAA